MSEANRGQAIEQPFHFFASSWHSWRCSESLPELIKYMEGIDSDMDYLVVYVPLPAKSQYQIENYVPKVEGVISLGKYKTPAKKGRRA